VRKAAEFLNEGGYFQILCNWAQIAGQDWRERLDGWFKETGCDVWVLRSHAEDINEYAFNRASEITDEPEKTNSLLKEWTAYYRREQIKAVGFGLITMRRRAAASSQPANWVRYDNLPGVRGSCGEAIERGFATRNFLEANGSDQVLLKMRLRCAEKVELQRKLENGRLRDESRIRIADGLTFTAIVDSEVVDFLRQCQGNQQVGDYLKKLAAKKKMQYWVLAPAFLQVVRHLLEVGFLLP
jgi:hypothetical protein